MDDRPAPRLRRILYVHNSADTYGASRSLVRLLKTLDRGRFEPSVLLPSAGPLREEIERLGIRVLIFPALSLITREVFNSWQLPFFLLNIPLSALRLERLLKKERIDLVHTNTGVILSSGLAARLAGVPHIWHIRDWFQEFKKWWGIYEWWIRKFSDRVVAVSHAVAAQFSKAAPLRVIPNGFAVEEFTPDASAMGTAFRRQFQLGDAPVIGCVGRIKLQRKGQEVLLRAAALLKARGVRAKFLIIGAPSPGNEFHLEVMREIVRTSGLEEAVVFTGEVADPLPAHAAMDIFVLPSAQPEPFGGVVMEAMCMGLPVVATGIGGTPEQVVDGETGFLVPPDDPEALADRLETLLGDAAMRERFGAAGRRRVAEHFRLSESTKAVMQIYEECFEQAAGAEPTRSPAVGERGARNRVKVLFVNNSADIYGASRCLVRLLERLDPERFYPIVMLPERGPLEAALRRTGVEIIFQPQLGAITRDVFRSWRLVLFLAGLPQSIFTLWSVLKRHRIDLVHTNTGVMLSPGPAAWLAGIPNVWHIRDWFQEFRGFWKYYAFYIHFFSRRILAVSGPIAAQFPPRYETTVVHDGFEMQEFVLPDPEAGRKFRTAYQLHHASVIGCVGRIKLQRKGQEVLLRAASVLKRRGIEAKYLIVGAPFPGNESHLDALRDIVRENTLGDDVIFTGELPDARPAYAAMDIFVLPSAQPEPFGGVVMEAMGMGLPVVATKIGGSVEQVADGESGYLVPPGDPEALADKLEILLRDDALRTRMGTAGRLRIVEKFALREMVEKIVGIYEECLREPR